MTAEKAIRWILTAGAALTTVLSIMKPDWGVGTQLIGWALTTLWIWQPHA